MRFDVERWAGRETELDEAYDRLHDLFMNAVEVERDVDRSWRIERAIRRIKSKLDAIDDAYPLH